MSVQQDRALQDWGGYEPETQKALRFVASIADVGTAKQVANAIAREYAKREKQKPAKRNALSEDDVKVLKLFVPAHRNREYEDFVRWSRLSEERFSECIDNLVKHRYLVGDALFGYSRTKKPFPSEITERIANAIQEKVPGWKLDV